MTDKPKSPATEDPPISLTATQARPSNRVIRSTLLKALETDPTTVGRSEVEHDRADRFKLERLALPDGNPTSYLLCRHFACEERPFKDKVFLGIGKSGKVTNSQVKNHMEIGYHGGTMEQLSEAAAEVCISLRLPPTLFSSDSFKRLTEFLSDGYFPGGINEEDIRGHFEQKGYDPEWESEEEMN
ncbi:Oidioi.mRNA.OKI2018_I69.XSR.g14212.t1.cds [Oikopleura dioica]|uniref:Oidioi.mRNA.OKI2018_I69.XSR.g14212.t1.cds n=1 Tax=Oikopleura dioica TaxID=34765 RepID=A0ABN7SD67_OIKDI|nr:Oidioi.mRNA.OKI2018_I69.XSR.g14212.t1.cds [Oikopleura dioica]